MINNPYGLISRFSNQRVGYLRLIVILGLMLIATACSDTTSGKDLPVPEDGNANVIGKIQNSKGEPYFQFNLRLAEVYWQNDTGAYVLDESFSPGAITDSDGIFHILNAPAGEYVVILGAPNQEYKAITDEGGVLKRITITAGETFDLGLIKYNY